MAHSSKRWLKEHISDHYVKKAQTAGYPSRAAFKLLEIADKDHIFKKGQVVLDLGAAPGGWSMVAKEAVGPKGRVIALDLLEMASIPGVEFLQGDFTSQEVFDNLLNLLNQQPVDVVLSDMAPNLSGQKSVDQPRSIHLVELALDCAEQALRPGGTFLAKVFQGEGVDALRARLRQHFKTVKTRKPQASRSRSREIYLLAQGFALNLTT